MTVWRIHRAVARLLIERDASLSQRLRRMALHAVESSRERTMFVTSVCRRGAEMRRGWLSASRNPCRGRGSRDSSVRRTTVRIRSSKEATRINPSEATRAGFELPMCREVAEWRPGCCPGRLTPWGSIRPVRQGGIQESIGDAHSRPARARRARNGQSCRPSRPTGQASTTSEIVLRLQTAASRQAARARYCLIARYCVSPSSPAS